jgi:hypothetical protein
MRLFEKQHSNSACWKFDSMIRTVNGNVVYDLFRWPGTWQGDLGLAKHSSLSEPASLQFRSEFFNIFNHPQLGPPRSTFNPLKTTGFGRIISTVNTTTPISPVGSGTQREIQFALRGAF